MYKKNINLRKVDHYLWLTFLINKLGTTFVELESGLTWICFYVNFVRFRFSFKMKGILVFYPVSIMKFEHLQAFPSFLKVKMGFPAQTFGDAHSHKAVHNMGKNVKGGTSYLFAFLESYILLLLVLWHYCHNGHKLPMKCH